MRLLQRQIALHIRCERVPGWPDVLTRQFGAGGRLPCLHFAKPRAACERLLLLQPAAIAVADGDLDSERPVFQSIHTGRDPFFNL